MDEKVFHGKFFREVKEVADERSWQLVKGWCCTGAGVGNEVGEEYQV